MPVERPQQEVHRRLEKASVVVEPALDTQVHPLGQFGQALACPPGELPLPDFIAETLGLFGADGGVEPVEVPAIPGPDSPRSELIGQKLELLAGMRPCSLVVPAVHDLRLLLAQFQPALL